MMIAIPLHKFEFFPDKPSVTTLSCLKRLDNGKYTAVSKLDGYNLFMCNEGGNVTCYSRTWKPLPVAAHLRKAWLKLVRDSKIPDKSIINCEWMRMRAGPNGIYDGPEMIYLLTPYIMDGLFIGFKPYSERRQWLESLGLPIDDLSIRNSANLNYELVLPAIASDNFKQFFEMHRGIYRTEGVIICSNKGRLIANQHNSIKTKDMLKCKWRSGDDGRTEI